MISTIGECVNVGRAGAQYTNDVIFQLLRINYALFVSLTRSELSNSRRTQFVLRYRPISLLTFIRHDNDCIDPDRVCGKFYRLPKECYSFFLSESCFTDSRARADLWIYDFTEITRERINARRDTSESH